LIAIAWPCPGAAPVKERDSTGVTERLERLERQMRNEGLMDLLQQVQALQQEVSRLRGELDVQANTLEQMRERERALHADMDRRLQALEPGTAVDADTAAPSTDEAPAGVPPLEQMSGVPAEADAPAGPEADTPLSVETVGTQAPAASGGTRGDEAPASGTGTDQADYDQAFWLLKQARYDEAIRAFRGYRAAWPAGRYADSAQYWLGEGYYASRNFEQALIEYERVMTEFPESQKLTHALLKSAYCLQELGRHDEARKRLGDLVKGYPGTTAARLAEERLRTMAAAARAP
jgi:tol-pal system protein YbgF